MRQLKLLSDQELISLYLNDNHSNAFEVLLNRHRDKIYTSIYLFVKDTETAEDIFQEVFIKIIDTLRKGKYQNEDKFQQWAMRIAYNLCVDYFRKSKKMSFIAGTDTFDPFTVIQSGDEHMESRIIKSEMHTRLRTLIDQLPTEQREVIILRHYADMSFKDIAKLTRVSINTSLGRMRYALINLRKMMADTEMVA
ncbi:MAG: sigma-70 family RNA polymerase sigma factor [Chitinophagales bacterium]|nr:sigma-70 family RNA polymerase sigma factor [Chitinophagales bacterium]